MSQEFDWTQFAYELAPFTSYLDFYVNQPRIYMFQGVKFIDNVILLATIPLTLIWIIILFKMERSMNKEFICVGIVQIVFNILIRSFKSLLINLTPYPSYSSLIVAGDLEAFFNYSLHLQFTSTVLFYFIFRESKFKEKLARYTYILMNLFWFLLSFLNVKFNRELHSFPFYGYVLTYVGLSGSNIVIMITILASCGVFAKEKKSTKTRLFLSIFIASPPIIFNTIITIMDLLFMVISVSNQFPIPYLIMITYRYKAYQMTPFFILLSYFAILPDCKKTSSSPSSETTNDVKTEAISHSKKGSKQSENLTTESSTTITETVSLPGEVVAPTIENLPSPPSILNTPMPTSGEFPVPNYGGITVHITPLRY